MLSEYNRNGHITIKNILSNHEKKKIIDIFFDVLDKYVHIPVKNRNLNNNLLHEKLIDFRKKNPKDFGQFYDELKLNAYLRLIMCSKKFIKLSSKILRTKENLIFMNGFQIRLDEPFATRNTYGWHQDSPYYMEGYPKFNSFICWLPITDNSVKNGTVQCLSKSHANYIKTVFVKKKKLNSREYKFKLEKNKKIKNFNANFGDAGIFHMNLIHRSGINSSNKVRITMAFRCHDLAKSFNVGKEIYIYNNKTIYRKQKMPPKLISQISLIEKLL